MKTVLVIEDNPFNARLVMDILETLGYAPSLAEDGPSGIQAATDSVPDVILMDLMLPGSPGDEVVAEMRQIPALADVPIIALTANNNPELRRRCMEAGCSDYMTKPFTKRALQEIIERHLS